MLEVRVQDNGDWHISGQAKGLTVSFAWPASARSEVIGEWIDAVGTEFAAWVLAGDAWFEGGIENTPPTESERLAMFPNLNAWLDKDASGLGMGLCYVGTQGIGGDVLKMLFSHLPPALREEWKDWLNKEGALIAMMEALRADELAERLAEEICVALAAIPTTEAYQRYKPG